MLYGILGDIHSNLSALEAVLEKADSLGVETILSVGDVVGYGAAPSECIRILQEREAVVVMGNHDAACVGLIETNLFNPYARAAVEWTKQRLSADEAEWLRNLPYSVVLEHCQVAHGTIASPELFDYLLSPTDAEPSLKAMESAVGFVGHTHVPIAILRYEDDPGRTAYTMDEWVDLSNKTQALINVGSVGQPRDEDPRTALAVFDSTKRVYWLHRIEYDIDGEASRIRSAGLPSVLADRLFLGV